MDQIIICIIPKEPVFSDIKKLMVDYSSKLGSKKALTFPPHLTLIGRFKTHKYDELKKELAVLFYDFKFFKIELKGLLNFDSPKILFLKPCDLTNLKLLHEELLDLVSDFREPWIRDTFKEAGFSEKQKEYVKLYGSPYVKEFYNPHLTLAGPDVDEKKFSEIIDSKFQHTYDLTIDTIKILKRVGDNWVIEEINK